MVHENVFHVNFLGSFFPMNLYRNLHEKYPVHEMLTFHTSETMNIL